MNVIIVPCSFDNYSYLVVCEKTKVCAVVDPSEYYPVTRAVQQNNLKLTTILCTHHHRDHIDGVEDLKAEYPDLQVYAHTHDTGRIAGGTDWLEDGATIHIGELEGKMYHTPGHTQGSCVYHFEDALFTGDTLFGGGCGRLFEGSAEQMFESLTRITELFDPGTKIYPGHEYTLANLEFAHALEPENHTVRDRLDWEKQKKKQNACRPDFDLALEKRTNPFLRSHAPDLQAAIQRRDKGVGDAPVDIFRVIRSLKDNV